MERNKIILDNNQLRNLVYEEYLVIDNKDIPVAVIQNEYVDSGRHQEYHNIVFKTLEDNKYYSVNYSTSVKDEMGWDECNYPPHTATEVFPKKVETIVYR